MPTWYSLVANEQMISLRTLPNYRHEQFSEAAKPKADFNSTSFAFWSVALAAFILSWFRGTTLLLGCQFPFPQQGPTPSSIGKIETDYVPEHELSCIVRREKGVLLVRAKLPFSHAVSSVAGSRELKHKFTGARQR